MTKKEKKELIEEVTTLEQTINSKILQSLGMDISQGYIVDQDSFRRIKFGRKNIKYSTNNEVLMHNNDIIFDPLNNTKMAIYLFDIFLRKEHEENGIYINLYYPIIDSEKTAIEIQKVDGETTSIFRSEYYKMPSYGYAEIMLSLFGINDNTLLHRLDELKSYDL